VCLSPADTGIRRNALPPPPIFPPPPLFFSSPLSIFLHHGGKGIEVLQGTEEIGLGVRGVTPEPGDQDVKLKTLPHFPVSGCGSDHFKSNGIFFRRVQQTPPRWRCCSALAPSCVTPRPGGCTLLPHPPKQPRLQHPNWMGHLI